MKHILCTAFIVLLLVHCVQAQDVPFVELKGHTAMVTYAAFSPDGKKIVTISMGDNTARIWDADSGKELQRLEGDAYQLLAVGFSPDGKRLVTSQNGTTARIWDISAIETK